MNKAAKVSVQNDAQDGKKAAATKGRSKHIHMQARRPISTLFSHTQAFLRSSEQVTSFIAAEFPLKDDCLESNHVF